MDGQTVMPTGTSAGASTAADDGTVPAQESTAEGSLVELLCAQRDVCVQLQRIIDRQRTLVTEDDPSALLRLLAERQALTDRLSEMAHRVAKARRAKPSPEADPAVRGRVESLLAEIRSKVHQMIDADAGDVARLEARKRSVGETLRTVGAQRSMLAAYSPGGGRGRVGALDRTDQS